MRLREASSKGAAKVLAVDGVVLPEALPSLQPGARERVVVDGIADRLCREAPGSRRLGIVHAADDDRSGVGRATRWHSRRTVAASQ